MKAYWYDNVEVNIYQLAIPSFPNISRYSHLTSEQSLMSFVYRVTSVSRTTPVVPCQKRSSPP